MKALPEPPRSLRVQGWIRSIGIFLLGFSALVGAFIILNLLDIVEESVDLAKKDDVEADCRAALSNDVNKAQGEINSRGWIALLSRVSGVTPEELKDDVDELNILVIEWREAQDRRDRAEEICR